MRLQSGIGSIRHIGNSLVFLGLLGTVIGFIMALSGVDAQAAGDVESIAPMVTTLIDGMSVALYTTLVGAVLNIWLMVNYRLLEGGTVTLLTTIVELGERHVRT
jgi:biopolymer transport protein ExbB/TolQ